MIAVLRRIWRRHRLLSLAFLLAVALSVGFAVRTLHRVPRFGAQPDLAIAGWMTPRLVGHARGIPPDVMAAALGLQPGAARGRTLDQIASEAGVPVAEIIARIEAAAAAYHAHPPGGEGG
jgi:hypothetical protein